LVQQWAPGAPAVDLDPKRVARRARRGRLTSTEKDAYIGSYHAEVAWIDENFGALIDGLRRAGRLDNAYVAILGDHGEMLFDDPSAPVGHGADIDLAVTHVPYAITGFGVRRATPRVIDTPVPVSSLGPTLLTLTAGPAAAESLGDGLDLSPMLRGETVSMPTFFLEATKPVASGGAGRWNNLGCEKGALGRGFLYIEPRSPQRRPAQLYRVDAQQSRSNDVAASAALRGALHEWSDRAPSFRAETMGEDQREALQALGYIEPDAAEVSGTPTAPQQDTLP
jgi:arylsulfatase A-like enzyme